MRLYYELMSYTHEYARGELWTFFTFVVKDGKVHNTAASARSFVAKAEAASAAWLVLELYDWATKEAKHA